MALAALAAVGLLRLVELLYARRTARLLRAADARLLRDDGMGLLVAVHVLWFASAGAETLLTGVRIGWWSTLGALGFAAGLALRFWSMQSLGWRWSTRVWVLPSAPLVTHGPYRWLRHPIYVGVALELAGLPVAFGLWWTAAALFLVHGAAVLRRIRIEEHALGLA